MHRKIFIFLGLPTAPPCMKVRPLFLVDGRHFIVLVLYSAGVRIGGNRTVATLRKDGVDESNEMMVVT
jgi:hypothetical protein